MVKSFIKKMLVCSAISALALHVGLYANLLFSDQSSRLLIGSGSTLKNGSSSLDDITGSIVAQRGSPTPGQLIGNAFTFDGGIISNENYRIELVGRYDPSNTFSYVLAGGGNRFYVRDPGAIEGKVSIRSTNNRLEGQPIFNNDQAVVVANSGASLDVDLLRELNTSIVLNNGTLNLRNNLGFGDDAKISGSGTVNFNTFNLILGQADLVWTDTLKFVNAENIEFGATNRLTGEWIFQGDALIIGNNNTLDLTNGGTIWIKNNTKVRMANMILQGLGSGYLVFEDKTSELELFNVDIRMDRSYTITNGGIKVVGPTRVVTGNKFLNFSLNASLTVDTTTMLYDSLSFLDRNNIRFQSTDNNLTYLNGGSIRKFDSLILGDFVITGNTQIDRSFLVSPLRRIVVENTATINGAGFYYQFARDTVTSTPLITIPASTTLTFTNILLQDFAVENVSQGANAVIKFGEKSVVSISENSTLTYTWFFEGNCRLNGNKKILRIGTGGSIVVRPGSSLLIDNIEIRGLETGKLRCMDNTSTISFGSVTLKFDDVFTFSHGRFELIGELDLVGTTTFVYATPKQSLITKFGTMVVEYGMSFSYDVPVNDRGLLAMETVDSLIVLNNSSLGTTQTGLRLTVGNLYLNGSCKLYDESSTALSEAYCFGDGTPANDLTITFGPNATLNLISGILSYENQE